MSSAHRGRLSLGQWRLALLAVALLGAAPIASATGADTVISQLQSALSPALSALTSKATGWLGAFATLQLCITNINVLKGDGDLQQALAKTIGVIAWTGFCLYLINNGPALVQNVGNGFFTVISVKMPDPGTIMTNTFAYAGVLTAAAIGVGVASNVAGTILWWLAVATLIVGLYFAFKIFMLQLEVTLVAMLSPLSFALLGLNPLRDQGIAPFKSLVSLAYRIILFTVICEGFNGVTSNLSTAFSAVSLTSLISDGGGSVVNTLLTAMGAYLLLGFLAFKSDSIASSLAAGSTSLAPGDVAQAVAAGTAAGMAASKVAGAAAGMARGAPKSMAAFLGKMSGGASVSNASSSGSGGEPAALEAPAAPAASMSLASGASPAPAGGSASTAPPASKAAARSAAGPSAGLASGRYGATPAEPPAASIPGSPGAPAAAPAGESASSAAPGSGLTAGISGSAAPQSTLERDLGKLVEHLSTPKETTARDALGDLGGKLQQERAATHAHISGHHAD